jgi:hypothetical protein
LCGSDFSCTLAGFGFYVTEEPPSYLRFVVPSLRVGVGVYKTLVLCTTLVFDLYALANDFQ